MKNIERSGNTEDAYRFYKSKGGTYSFEDYNKVIVYFNKAVIKEMINNGRVLVLPKNMGKLAIATIYRNFNVNVVNWPETMKNYRNGIKQMIYFTDAFSLKYYFLRGPFINKRFYKFKPTKGINGNVRKLIEANKQNPLLYKKYIQINKD